MNTKVVEHSQKFLRQRRFMMLLPLLVIPFVTIFFIALGGGKRNTENRIPQQTGFNTILPDAHFKKGREKDKLGIYEETAQDSAKIREAMKNDPYYYLEHQNDTIKNKAAQLEKILERNAAKYDQPNYSKLQTSATNLSPDSNEQRVMRKLELLKKALIKKPTDDYPARPYTNDDNGKDRSSADPGVQKLKSMMQMLDAKNAEPDPEVNQLDKMLDKVMLIQHPEKMQDSMKRLSEKNKTQTFVVTRSRSENNISLMDTADQQTQAPNSFYGLQEDSDTSTQKQNAIEAVIPESQTLVSGSTVKLRLLNDIFVNGIKIPRDELVYGTAALSNERLRIAINSLRYQDNILPVSLEVYDMDGMQGIYIPGSIDRDVSKQSADDAISSIGLTTIDPSIGAQATSAGIQAAKTLATRKIKLIRVLVRSGYKVLLKDSNQK